MAAARRAGYSPRRGQPERAGTAFFLPRPKEVERLANPEALLAECILAAASVTGRRRDRLAKRFTQNRRQLLERLDPDGPVVELEGWALLSDRVTQAVAGLDGSTSG